MIESPVIAFLFFIFGICIGSFLNVCIVRWPHEESVVKPGSHCRSCKKPIAWHDNIPVLSYILLGGKCRYCHAKYSPRYAFIEFFTGVAFVLFYAHYGLDPLLVPYLFMLCCFIIATMVDFGHRIIPDEVSVGGLAFGLVFSAVLPAMHQLDFGTLNAGRWVMRILVATVIVAHLGEILLARLRPAAKDDGEEDEPFEWLPWLIVLGAMVLDLIMDYGIDAVEAAVPAGWVPHLLSLDAACIGFVVGGGSIYAMGVLGDFLFRKDSMGGGDVKLLAMVGAFLGWKASILAFFIAPFFGAVFGLLQKLKTNDTTIAYGPFLVLGSLIALFCEEQIIYQILHLYGLR
ncbi:MAG: prepilin peptidase [Candidatus Omnitrophica bacterium]|nr:prepilin peptidase [Candidatus Omnitrophota bacterium]MCB9721272.1 prepilin peptidase [Candidatus Omnitrophota bacterium]